ncbi:MAG TPA: STAS domain-containing protein [Candidatus Acidoferrales bacterium]|nr:STAS domain-containing protein [Candidatus Acidoferrales bacterium]
MKIQLRRAGSTTILDLDGPLSLGPPQQELRREVEGLMAAGAKLLAINLAGVAYMDSSGIGELVRTYTVLRQAGGKCVLFAANKQVMMLLKMVRLDTVLPMAPDETAALAAS